jgi:GGDEF domain-containing protein
MRDSDEKPTRANALAPAMSELNQSDRENRRLRILLMVLMLAEVVAVFVPRFSNQWRSEFGFLPQILIGFVVLALIFTLHLAAQRKLLREVSTALVAATSYVDRLEQISLIDPPTQLFNRRYVHELFNHQLNWVNGKGKSATLLLLAVLPSEQKLEQIVVEVAFTLRSNFRGSDYVIRYSADQFLVVLPDTDEQQAQFALSRLIDMIDHCNLANENWSTALRLALKTCHPDGNLWENLNNLEERLRDKSDLGVRTLIAHKSAGNLANETYPGEHIVQ